MGGTTSAEKVAEIFNSSVNNTINSTLVTIARQTQAISTTTQTIDLSGLSCGGAINISGISQKSVAIINTNIMSNNVNQNTLSNMLTNAIKQASDSDQDTTANFLANTLSKNIATDKTVTKSDIINTIANSYTLNDFQNDMQSINTTQSINLSNMSSNDKCTISNLSQNARLDIVSKNMSTRMTNTLTKLLTQTNYDQAVENKQIVKSTGPLEEIFSAIGNIFTKPIVYAIIAMIVLLVVIITIAIRLSGGKKQQYPMYGPESLQPQMHF